MLQFSPAGSDQECGRDADHNRDNQKGEPRCNQQGKSGHAGEQRQSQRIKRENDATAENGARAPGLLISSLVSVFASWTSERMISRTLENAS